MLHLEPPNTRWNFPMEISDGMLWVESFIRLSRFNNIRIIPLLLPMIPRPGGFPVWESSRLALSGTTQHFIHLCRARSSHIETQQDSGKISSFSRFVASDRRSITRSFWAGDFTPSLIWSKPRGKGARRLNWFSCLYGPLGMHMVRISVEQWRCCNLYLPCDNDQLG